MRGNQLYHPVKFLMALGASGMQLVLYRHQFGLQVFDDFSFQTFGRCFDYLTHLFGCDVISGFLF